MECVGRRCQGGSKRTSYRWGFLRLLQQHAACSSVICTHGPLARPMQLRPRNNRPRLMLYRTLARIVRNALLSFTIAMSVAVILWAFSVDPSAKSPSESADGASLVMLLFGACVFSPVIEGLGLAALYRATSSRFPPTFSAVMAGLVSAMLHSLVAWQWGVVVFIPLVIFALPFARVAVSFRYRLGESALTHSLHNLMAIAAILLLDAPAGP